MIYSLATLISTSTQMGLEYTLLKKSHIDQSRVLGVALATRCLIIVATAPVLIYVIENIYNNSLSDFTWIALSIFITYSLTVVGRYMLLGSLNVRSLLIIDVFGAIARISKGTSLFHWDLEHWVYSYLS
jgi:peptidoglycan biosynthesis protein MviN/MurJ (putative lipid II flippase)